MGSGMHGDTQWCWLFLERAHPCFVLCLLRALSGLCGQGRSLNMGEWKDMDSVLPTRARRDVARLACAGTASRAWRVFERERPEARRRLDAGATRLAPEGQRGGA